jgi:hypothetical protein
VSLVAILLPLRISQEQGVRKEPRTMVDLKQNVREHMAAISPNMLQRVKQQKRLGNVLTREVTSQTPYSGSECYN